MINYVKLMNRCNQSIESFHTSDSVKCPNGLHYTFFDRKSDVLAVAHLDTVQTSKHFMVTPDLTRIYTARLDDRLGVYTIFDVLPKLGIRVDVLLTEGEESANSTARYFSAEKQYNWIVEFDRGGDDVVVYDYRDSAWDKTLESVGYTVGHGSYTDICELEDLNAKAFNVGVGYHNPHGIGAYMIVDQYLTNIKRFNRFWHKYHKTHFPHESYWYEVDDSDYIVCPLCDQEYTNLSDCASILENGQCLLCNYYMLRMMSTV